jgi:hypothetical protein
MKKAGPARDRPEGGLGDGRPSQNGRSSSAWGGNDAGAL